MKSIEIMDRDDSLLKKLWNNSEFLKEKLRNIGYNTGRSKTPITPVMVGGEKETIDLSKTLYEEGVFASPIVFPTVAKGAARIRLMPSAVHSREDLKYAGDRFEEVGKKLKLI